MSTRAILSVAAFLLGSGLPAVPALAQTSGAPAFVVQADVVTAGENKGIQGQGCVNQSVFFPGDVLVFRAQVADPVTGKPLTKDDIAARGVKVVVTTSEGATVNLRYGLHPPPNVPVPSRGLYWSGTLPISRSHPTGTLPWTLTASDNAGHSLTYTPLGQGNGAAVLTIAQRAPASP